MTAPTPAALDALVAAEPDFVQGLQGYASFCETLSRGQPEPDDLLMLANKFRDAAVVITLLQKLRDELRAQVTTLTADLAEARSQRDEQKSYTIQGDDLRRELFADLDGERARLLAADTARASAETALAEARGALTKIEARVYGSAVNLGSDIVNLARAALEQKP